MQGELAKYRAHEIVASAESIEGDRRLVVRSIDADANGLKSLAMAIVEQPGHIVVLTSTTKPALVVVARSADVDMSASQILASLIAAFGGRGGGKAELAQGGGVEMEAAQILVAARADIWRRAQR